MRRPVLAPAHLVLAPLALALLLLAAPAAHADPGVRVGITDNPDTVSVGFFYEAPLSYSRSAIFALEPGADVGFGDHDSFITIRGTLNAKVMFPVGRRALLYPIIGLSVYHVSCDGCNDDTFAGLNLGGGFRFHRVNFELTAGIRDLPDLTFTVGFLF